MSKSEIIERLGALLARVRVRSAEPRRAFAGPDGTSAGALGARATATAISSPRPTPEAEVDAEGEIPFRGELREATPAAADDVDAELSASVLDEPFRNASDSQERLAPAESPAEPAGGTVHELSVRGRARVSDLAPDAARAGSDVVEEAATEQAPVSSRRPVAPEPEERLAQLAFGAEEEVQGPRHTPPPESGQLLTAPQLQFERDVTGVRDAPTVSPHRSEEAVAFEVGGRPTLEGGPGAHGGSRELTAQVMRPQIAASAGVADVLGEAQRFAPTTFLALLDASLKL